MGAFLCASLRIAHADDALTVSVADAAVGDGRTFVPVTTAGGPKAQGKELPVADAATLSCTGAATLAGPPNALPGVLAPVVTAPTTIACKAQLHGAESAFKLQVRPPPAGLYASVTATARSTAPAIELSAIEWDGKKATPPTALRAAASDATTAVSGGKLSVTVSGKVPRLVAVALVDGPRIGAAFVPVIGVTTLPVESEAQSKVEVWVAGSWYGPVPTKGKIADVPIEVPPGVTHVVARSTSARGYVTDAVTDLKIPPRPRIAALAVAPTLGPGQTTTIAIAVAGGDGRPGLPSLKLVAAADRGQVAAVQSRGTGLWSVEYTAPKTPGADKVIVKIDGDASAGTGEAPLDITGGAATRIDLGAPQGTLEPGGELRASVAVFDKDGNRLGDSAATATLGNQRLAIDDGIAHGKIPEQLPAGGALTLDIAAGGSHKTLEIRPRATPVTASVTSETDGRDADLVVIARDRFGNLVQDGTFEIAATGARVGTLTRTATAFHGRVSASERVTTAHVVVRAAGGVLAETDVRFEPPAYAYVVGVWASGGWMDNLGALQSPRASAGLAIRRGVGPIEAALSAGVEGITSTQTMTFDQAGTPTDAERTVAALGVPVLVRVRVPITRKLGIAIAGGVVPTRARAQVSPAMQSTQEDVSTVVGARAQLTGDLRLGPGRAFLGASFGRAKLDAATASGQLDGVAVIGGYEWWFGAFGW